MKYQPRAFGWLFMALCSASSCGGGSFTNSSGSGGVNAVATGGNDTNGGSAEMMGGDSSAGGVEANAGGDSSAGGTATSSGGNMATGGASSTPATSTGPDLDQLPKIYAEAACAALDKCSAALKALMMGANDCVTLISAQVRNGSLPGIKAAVAAGKVTYNASAIDQCRDAVANTGCSLSDNAYLPACEASLAGTAAQGGPCAINEECAGDFYCKYDGSCPGTCSAREPESGLCRNDGNCKAGLTCFIQSGSSSGTCVAKPKLGDDCGRDKPSACASQASGAGVVCWGASSTKSGKCVAIDAIASQGVNAECHLLDSVLCRSGLSCQLTPNSLNGTCVTPVTSATTCVPAFPDPCPNDDYCTATATTTAGSCQLLPLDGQPCVTTPLAVLSNKQCGNQNVCINNTCTGLRSNGSACTSNSVCYSARCDTQSQKCVPNQYCSP